MNSFVQLENICKSFGEYPVLNQISLQLERGEEYAIIGASGSGKSTLLYLLGGLDVPDRGEIFVADKNLALCSDSELARYRNEVVGFIFQFHFLLPSMNCFDNIVLPAKIGGHSLEPVQVKSEEMARKLGVLDCLQKYPWQLSGGEKQRVNMIRAVSLSPKLLLCDEPTGNLDSKNSSKVSSLLRELAQEYGSTLVVVTHDKLVASLFQKQFFIADGKVELVRP